MSAATPKEEPSSEDPVKDAVAEEESGIKTKALDAVFGTGYNKREVQYVICAAILIAFNNGFVNGVCMSGILTENLMTGPRDLESAMVSGTAGYVTQSTTGLLEPNWDLLYVNATLLLSYMFGAFITALLSPKAKPYAIDPLYGPSFLIGATMLLGASLLSVTEQRSRYIYMLAICSNGIQNGIASIYSANLIRCTLTGALTDIALVFGMMIRGNNSKAGRGIVLSVIVSSFWMGGIISFPLVRVFRSYTLFINAILFYTVGFLCVFYLTISLNISFTSALSGTWDWTDVLAKITPSGDKQSLLNLFDSLDHDGGGSLDMYELQKGLEGKVTEQELKTLLIAADSDGDGEINKQEWIDLVDKLYDGKEGADPDGKIPDELVIAETKEEDV